MSQLDMIPLVDLKANYAPLRTSIMSAISDCLDSMHLFMGPNLRAFEEEFPAYCRARYGLTVGNGTDALHLALRACGVGPGDEVITVSHTFIATAEAIWLLGARPVFVEIDPVTYTMDPATVEAAITPATRAIVPVHLYGLPADMTPIVEVARRHGLYVIEDACQAHGAEYYGRRTGTLGDAACYSFYFSKNLGAYGEAGAVVTNDDGLHAEMVMLRDHGSESKYIHRLRGVNHRMDEIQAAVLRIKLRRLDEWNEARREHADTYRRLLAGAPLTCPTEPDHCRHVYHIFAVLTPERDRLARHLADHQIQTGVHYPLPVHLQTATADHGLPPGRLPVTERVAQQELSLPIYPEITPEQLQRVADAVGTFVPRQRDLLQLV